jgi:hypothetical protein
MVVHARRNLRASKVQPYREGPLAFWFREYALAGVRGHAESDGIPKFKKLDEGGPEPCLGAARGLAL